MKALNWNWAGSNFETPSSIEIKNTLLNLFELGEKGVMRGVKEDLEKIDGAYTIAKTKGLTGTFDGNGYAIKGLTAPLFGTTLAISLLRSRAFTSKASTSQPMTLL